MLRNILLLQQDEVRVHFGGRERVLQIMSQRVDELLLDIGVNIRELNGSVVHCLFERIIDDIPLHRSQLAVRLEDLENDLSQDVILEDHLGKKVTSVAGPVGTMHFSDPRAFLVMDEHGSEVESSVRRESFGKMVQI